LTIGTGAVAQSVLMPFAGETDASMPAAEVISMVLMADPVSLSVVRERFRRWLVVLRWPRHEVDDVVMAVNEAVSIAVEHTYQQVVGAEVHVAARLFAEPDGGRRIMVGVGGSHPWCPEPAETEFRGHALLMIHACMDGVELSRGADGTTMMMTSVKVPPL
jgi:serine/threonine-protein kinase RsbW